MYTPKLAKEDVKQFILENDHPCIMAQSVFSQENYHLHLYEGLGTEKSAKDILKDISTYLENYDFSSKKFFTFVAVFNDETCFSEIEFEKLLWKQLQQIHNFDDMDWDNSVSNNPKEDSFSFSIKGKAFYVVGMHPNSSRNARRSPKPTLVFNLHHQFEKLRQMGVYNRVRDTIRRRDLEKNGSYNPMLEDFGKRSEAMQYSGRKIKKDWKCPFKSMIK